MKKVERFEDLIAWQKARELTKQIYFLTNQGSFSKDFGLRDQIRKASVSIMSNLAEGFERGGRSEFHQFVVIWELTQGLYPHHDSEYFRYYPSLTNKGGIGSWPTPPCVI